MFGVLRITCVGKAVFRPLVVRIKRKTAVFFLPLIDVFFYCVTPYQRYATGPPVRAA